MLIENNSRYLLKKTRAKAKMYEYCVPVEDHIDIEKSAEDLLLIAVAVIGNISKEIWLSEEQPILSSGDYKSHLEFASLFLDALTQTEIKEEHNEYFLLLGAIAYYFCDKVGSSKVIIKMLHNNYDFEATEIEKVIIALLLDDINYVKENALSGKYSPFLGQIVALYNNFFNGVSISFSILNDFKNLIYNSATAKELLLADALLAILKKKIINSTLSLMPQFSSLDRLVWFKKLKSKSGLKELWQSQIEFGKAGVFNGKSAIVQMPTSAGKTTSLALAIQSSFLENRTDLVMIVAPFRALCKEIRFDLEQYFYDDETISINEYSDIPNSLDLITPFFEDDRNSNHIAILTPEKFIYLLRHDKTILEQLKMVVFDEAHLFDDFSRGTNYELLLSTIKYYLDESVQKILISAIISNAEQLNGWINGSNGVVIANNSIKGAEKTIAFGDWNKERGSGYLYFINPYSLNEEEFYVPRVVERQKLSLKGRERKARYFPSIDIKSMKIENKTDFSIYYTLKFHSNGATAIFCGLKSTVNKTLERLLEIEDRGYDISSLKEHVRKNEDEKISLLISRNLGENNNFFKSAQKGILAHHNGIPNGIRISAEFAIKNDLFRCIVCTSTLAEGVNLPIKYLLVSSTKQGGEQIKVRNFHNLIGRTGRAGKHTEGTVILTEPFVYNKRRNPQESWRYKSYRKLLNPLNSEDCTSNILRIFKPFQLQYNEKENYNINFENIIMLKYENFEHYCDKINSIKETIDKYYSKVSRSFNAQLAMIENTLIAIENFILYFISDNEELVIEKIVEHTFGYHLATDEEKMKITALFKIIKEYIDSNSDSEEKKLYAKSSLGIYQSEELKLWVYTRLNDLASAKTESEILVILLNKVLGFSDNKIFGKILNQEKLIDVVNLWIQGMSYKAIHQHCESATLLVKGKRGNRVLNLEEVVDLCDNGFGYGSILVVNAISEIVAQAKNDDEEILRRFGLLCQKMKYGLPSEKNILVYELGFSDRYLSQLISDNISIQGFVSKAEIKKSLKKKKELISDILSQYPAYFKDRLKKL